MANYGKVSSITQKGLYEPFELQVARGQIAFHTPVNVFGFSSSIPSANYATIWENSSAYVYPTAARIMTCVSSDAADTAVTIQIEGLDTNWNPIVENVALNGTTGVTTTQSFLRVNKATTIAGNAVGTVTVKYSSTTYAQITIGFGESQMAVYSVPAGHTYYQTYLQADGNIGTVSSGWYNLRTLKTYNPSGVNMILQQSSYLNNFQLPFIATPIAIPEKTDLQIQLKANAGSGYLGNVYFGGILIANSYDAGHA